MNRETIEQWGENTAYSAKGHFKSADLKRNYIMFLVIFNLIFSLLSVVKIDFQFNTIWLGLPALIASILILIYETRNRGHEISNHYKFGNYYLDIHYRLQELYNRENISDQEINEIGDNLRELIKNDSVPVINQLAKRIAKRSIVKKNEMKIWWK